MTDLILKFLLMLGFLITTVMAIFLYDKQMPECLWWNAYAGCIFTVLLEDFFKKEK